MLTNYKNRYHPLIILLYHCNMLSAEQIRSIPRSTRNDWNRFSHTNYFGFEMVEDYIEDFDYIKDVLTKKHLKRGMKFICSLSYGYRDVISEIEKNKKLLRAHSEKITFAIQRVARYGNINITDACSLFGVNRNWFYRHRKKKTCNKSIIEKCFRQYPNQLTYEEVEQIEKIVSTPENKRKTKTTLYYHAMRKGLIACGLSSFFKYADLTGYVKLPKAPKEERPKGFRATRPFEWLHVDVTHVQTIDDGVQYVAFIKDNFSKALLGYSSISTLPNSEFIRDLFERIFIKYKLLESTQQINILSDGGSENKGALLEWLNQITTPPVVKKLTAKTDLFPFSNSMSESTHSTYKTEFLQKKHAQNNHEHFKNLDEFMDYYCNQRYPFDHFGLTPNEVLNGEIPDRRRFSEDIQIARIKRIEKNRVFNKCPFSCL